MKLKIQLPRAAKDSVVFDQVLLVADDNKVLIGKPNVEKARVEAKIIRQGRGDKVIVFKYKSKTRYRVKRGFRPQFTEIEIQKISG